MRLFHIATVADWQAAQATGRYTTSTCGRTLAEEGFIHTSRADQWQGVRDRFYADVAEPLVLLVIDSELLTAPVLDEHVPGTDETFPHVYGAIEPGAVVRVLPLGRAPLTPPAPVSSAKSTPTASQRSFFSLFLEEAALRAGIGMVVLVAAVLLGLPSQRLWGDGAALVVILTALAIGFTLAAVVLRRRDRRLREEQQPSP
ncbi:MAG: DUF952 domain-containing protein [Marmoricola sp.]